MDERQQRVFNETRLRNLNKHYEKLSQHPELSNLALDVKKEIETLENQLQ